jgi:hypothetical protein
MPVAIDHRPPQSATSPAAADQDGVEALVGVPFEVDSHFYLVRRVNTRWRCGPSEHLVEPEEATAILERAIAQHRNHLRLVRLLETAATQLARLHDNGVFVLLWLRPERRVERVAPPAPRTPPAPALPAMPSVEEPPLPPLQATVLKEAAKTGVPFCEECARLAAEQTAAAAAS